jgi:phospholipid/cholesterol/gamma-HCH transport system substrate-binding protein
MKREKEVILGAIVFIGITILVVGAAWLSDNYWGPAGGYKVYASFESVMGLKKGNEVALRGVKVGKVLEIEMIDGRPRVLVGFRELRDIPKDSKIILRSVGMLGERIVEIRLGRSSEVFADGDLTVGSSELGMEDMTADAADMTNSVRAVIDSLTLPENISRMTASLRNVDTTTATLRNLLLAKEASLASTIDNLASATDDASGLMEESRAKIERSVANLDEATTGLARAAANVEKATASFETTMANLESITTKINAGQGTLGRLVNDPSAYEGMTRSITSVDSLIEAIKRDPGRYLNFNFTLF